MTKTITITNKQSGLASWFTWIFRHVFSISGYEVAGGKYEIPSAAATWVKSVAVGYTDDYVYGVIIGDVDTNITVVTYQDDAVEAELSYVGCLAGHFYAFKDLVKAVTFDAPVTLCIRQKIL